MTGRPSDVYILRIVDTDKDSETRTWLAGPHSRRADGLVAT
jgi:hypothetical protein